MPMADRVREEIKIHFEGLAADTGSIPVEDLIESLTGWRDFLTLSSSMFLAGKLNVTALPPCERPEVCVKAPERGSFEVTLELILKEVTFDRILAAAGLLLAAKNDKHIAAALKKLAKWIVALFQKHVEEKRQFHSVQQVAEVLEKLAREHEIQVGDDHAQSRKAVESVDSALKKATMPVEHSAETVVVSGVGDVAELNIKVSRSEHGAIQSHFFFRPEHEGSFQSQITVQSLNLKTKRVSGFVPESGHPVFKGFVSGHVRDQSLANPKNCFSRSLYTQEAISTWVVPERDPETSLIKHWDFYSEEPVVDTPLFEKPNESLQPGPTDLPFHLRIWQESLQSDRFWVTLLDNVKVSGRVRDTVTKAVVWLEMKGMAEQAKRLDDACQAMREAVFNCKQAMTLYGPSKAKDIAEVQALRVASVENLQNVAEQVIADVPPETWEGING